MGVGVKFSVRDLYEDYIGQYQSQKNHRTRSRYHIRSDLSPFLTNSDNLVDFYEIRMNDFFHLSLSTCLVNKDPPQTQVEGSPPVKWYEKAILIGGKAVIKSGTYTIEENRTNPWGPDNDIPSFLLTP